MNKKNIKPEAIIFNATYADILAEVNLLRKQLKQNISFVKKLAKKAQKLYDYSDDKCYIVDDNNDIRPIDGINRLGAKMDFLDWLINDADIEITDLANAFESK